MNNYKNQNGFSLIAVILIITFFVVLVLALATQIETGSRVNVIGTDQQKSFYLAESGIEYAIRRSKLNADWDWNDNVSFANGTMEIEVDSISPERSQIKVKGLNGITAARNDLIIKRPNHHFFGLYIYGDADDLVYGDSESFQTNQHTLPEMEIDSLRAISKKQGANHFFNDDQEFDGFSADWAFYSDEQHTQKDAEVIFVDGDLDIKGNVSLNGILIVSGDLIVQNESTLNLNGVLYFPGPAYSEISFSNNGNSGNHGDDHDEHGDDDDDDHGHGHGHDDDHGDHGHDDDHGHHDDKNGYANGIGHQKNDGDGGHDDDDHGHGHDGDDDDEHENHKVKVCHRGHTIEIAQSAVQAHLNHGDSLGECDDDDDENGSGKYCNLNVQGGIMGNVQIHNSNPEFQVTVNHNPSFLVKFYTYGKIERISWQNEY